ncbi:hypothetical protein PanWU01x14_133660, partial [Parasponia andersonii]
MPSRVPKFSTPLNTLKKCFPISKLISDLPLKFFGCTVFVHIPQHFRSKLDPRAEQCVFIGYAPNKKSYKCLNPKAQKTNVSMDVSFFENQSYFSQNSLQEENENNEACLWETMEIPL